MSQVGVIGRNHQIPQVGSHGFVKVSKQVFVHTHDHESNGRLQRHIYTSCLMGGRQLNHSEKDYNFKKQAKNEQTAAHH